MHTSDSSPNSLQPRPSPDRPGPWPEFALLIDDAPSARIAADQMLELAAAIGCELRRLSSHRAPIPTMTFRRLAGEDMAALPAVRSMPECTAVAAFAVIRSLLGGAK